MRVGGTIDVELPVKRVEVAGHPDKLFGRLVSLVEGGNTVALCAPEPRARHDIELALVDQRHCFPGGARRELLGVGRPFG